MDGGFMRREARIGPRFSHGDEMVVKRLLFSLYLQVTSILLKTKTHTHCTYKQYFLLLWLLSFPNVTLQSRHISFWPHLWEDRYLAGMTFLSQMENLGHKEVRMNCAHPYGRIEIGNRTSRIWMDWICPWQPPGSSRNWTGQDESWRMQWWDYGENQAKMRQKTKHQPYVIFKAISLQVAVMGRTMAGNSLPNSTNHQHIEGASSTPDPVLSIPLLLFHVIHTTSPWEKVQQSPTSQ